MDIPRIFNITEREQVGSGQLSKRRIVSQGSCAPICARYSGARLKETGEVFGVGANGVSQESRRFAAMIREDGDLMKVVNELREKIIVSMLRRDTYFLGKRIGG